MARGRQGIAFVAFNMLLILGGLCAGLYVSRAAGQYFAKGVLFAAPNDNGEQSRFVLADIRAARENFPVLSPEGRGALTIKANQRELNTPVTYCDADYFSIHFMDFIEGAPWFAEDQEAPLVILNESLAWYLFGGGFVTGMTVEMEGALYRITGVVRQDGAPQDSYRAWLPFNAARRNVLTGLYYKPDAYNPVDAYADVRRMLSHLNREDYTVTDINRYVGNMDIRLKVLLTMTWAYVLFFLLRGRVKRKKTKWLYPAAVAAVALLMVPNALDIVNWLMDLPDLKADLFAVISNAHTLTLESSLPYSLQKICRYNRCANYACVMSLFGLINLSFPDFILHSAGHMLY
ncbi:MAG: ABC transporter permease [Clostridiales bacterium]|nr:ABC transporter permease [Clostridiales bacterium]